MTRSWCRSHAGRSSRRDGSRPALRTVQHVGYGTSIRAAGEFAWAAGFDQGRVTPRGVARAHAVGLKSAVYTVNDRAGLLALKALGVDGVFSDRPDLAREVSPGLTDWVADEHEH